MTSSVPPAKLVGGAVRDVSGVDLSKLYVPHEGQEELHRSGAKTKIIRAARRWGKSRWLFWECMRRYLEAIQVAVPKEKVPPFHAWIVLPSYPQARQFWTEMLTFLPGELVFPNGVHVDDMYVDLLGSPGRPWGRIELKSSHLPQSLQTVGLDFLGIDEAQDVSDEAFYKVLATTRDPHVMGYAVFCGIPSLWRDHWFQQSYELAERDRKWDVLAVTRTFRDNPFLTPGLEEEIERDRERMPEAEWRRMYLAEFREDAGYFKNSGECAWGDVLSRPLMARSYVAGLDLGRKADATVLHVMDAAERRMVFRASYDQGADWPLIREAVNQHCRQFGASRLAVDATGMGGDIFCSELRELGLPVEEVIITEEKRMRLLMELAVSLERRTVSFPPEKPLLRQLRAFQLRRTPTGRPRPEAPPGEHDDEVFALALGLQVCQPPPDVGPPAGGRLHRRSAMYVPTQAEAESGIGRDTRGTLIVREHIAERRRQRHEAVEAQQ